MKPIKIILDTDIADDIDDAYALKYALSFLELELLGVTTVYKNVHQRSQMTKHLLALEGKSEIEVYAGLDNPLNGIAQPFPCEKVVGDKIQLLSYKDCYKNIKYSEVSAVSFILDTIKKTKGDMYIVAIGPLTNLATAANKNPELFKTLKGIYTMGGTPLGYHEWNIMVDPEAAKIIYGLGVPITAIGVDITEKTTFTDDEFNRAKLLHGKSCNYIVSMMNEWYTANKRNPVMHDSLAIDAIVNKHMDYKGFDVVVPLDKDNRGKTICTPNDKSHVRFATSLKRDEFMSMFFNIMEGK